MRLLPLLRRVCARTSLAVLLTWGLAAAAQQPGGVQALAFDDVDLVVLNDEVYRTGSYEDAPSAATFRFRVGSGPRRGAGFTGAALRPVLASDPAALAELDRFRSRRLRSAAGGAVAGAAVAAAVAVWVSEPSGTPMLDPRTGRPVNSVQTSPVVLVPIGVAAAGLLYGSVNHARSGVHIRRAVAIYNEGVLVRSSGGVSVAPLAGPDGGGLRLTVAW